MYSTPYDPAGPNCVTFGNTRLEDQSSVPKTPRKSPKKESLMQWFDKSVENELHRRKQSPEYLAESLVDPTASAPGGGGAAAPYVSPREAQSCTSGVDISERLRSAPDTELTTAVEKLAKAEAACYFAGAVRAAEEAAAAAPPELAEEAAAAGARDFHAEVTDMFCDSTGGDREKPIQVIGYIGITRPKKPRRS